MNYTYDYTGSNHDFVIQEEFKVFKFKQQIALRLPAYKIDPTSISGGSLYYFKVEILDTGDILGSRGEYAPGKTYTVIPCVEADMAKSDAMTESTDAAYNPEVIQLIQINYFGDDDAQTNHVFKIRVTYHAVRLSWVEGTKESVLTGAGYAFDKGPRYSPALMQKVLDRLGVLETATTGTRSLYGTALDTDDILDEDTTGLAPENYVEYERHVVNTSSGIVMLQPSKGAFYPTDGLKIITYVADPFTLTEDTAAGARGKLFIFTDDDIIIDNSSHVATERKILLTEALTTRLLADYHGTITGKIVDLSSTKIKTLERGIDYDVDSIDIARTARSTATLGVYQNIRFIRPLSQEVMISYQAFGGIAAAADIRALHQDITNTRTVLNDADLLTASTLEKNKFVLELNRRLRMMEQYHNHFNQVEHKIGILKGGWHWFNIATLYDFKWNYKLDKCDDIGQFRIESALRKWSYEFMVDVDLSRATDQIHVKTLGTNQYVGFDPYDITKIVERGDVALRLCWCGDGKDSGLMLQMGLDLNTYHAIGEYAINEYSVDTDTITVTDKSSNASLWSMVKDPDQINYPSNGMVAVYNHNKYTPTNDTVFNSATGFYYKFTDKYLYIRTADKYYKSGKRYFTRTIIEGESDEYNELAIGTSAGFMPGDPVATDPTSGEPTIYECVLYGNYATAYEVVAANSGRTDEIHVLIENTPIEGTWYVADQSTDDNSFTLPNTNLLWSDKDANCHYSVKPIEPEDGVIAWMGNIALAQFAPNFKECVICPASAANATGANASVDGKASIYTSLLMLGYNLQTYIKVSDIRGCTLVLFDRREGQYITVDGKFGINKLSEQITCEIPYCLEDLCFLRLKLYKDSIGVISEYNVANKKLDTSGKYVWDTTNANMQVGTSLMFMDVSTFLGTMSLKGDRFDLRQVRLHF